MPHGTQRLTSLRKCASSAQLPACMLQAKATLQVGTLPVATHAFQQGAVVLRCAGALLLPFRPLRCCAARTLQGSGPHACLNLQDGQTSLLHRCIGHERVP